MDGPSVAKFGPTRQYNERANDASEARGIEL